MIDPLPHNQKMTSRTSATKSGVGGSQKPPSMKSGHGCINMMSVLHVGTCSRDYGLSQQTTSKEPSSLEIPLYIDKIETIPQIHKGVLKHSRNNSNTRDGHNYSIIEDLGQNPYVMSTLEVL